MMTWWRKDPGLFVGHPLSPQTTIAGWRSKEYSISHKGGVRVQCEQMINLRCNYRVICYITPPPPLPWATWEYRKYISARENIIQEELNLSIYNYDFINKFINSIAGFQFIMSSNLLTELNRKGIFRCPIYSSTQEGTYLVKKRICEYITVHWLWAHCFLIRLKCLVCFVIRLKCLIRFYHISYKNCPM